MRLKETLISYLRTKGEWIPKPQLTDDVTWFHKDGTTRYIGETVGRALRHAEEEGIIAVKDHGKTVQYKYLPVEKRDSYIPWSKRIDKSVLFVAFLLT